MAREIVTRIWCDVCLHEGEQVEAEEMPPVAIGTMKPRLLALCERHTKELFIPLRDVLVELGQIIPATGLGSAGGSAGGGSSEIGVWPCPVPDCDKHATPYTHKQSLRNHCRDVHDSTLSALRTKYPAGKDEDPTSNQQVARRNEQVTAKSVTCPECEKPFRFPEYAQPTRALGVHRAKEHGVPGVSKTRKKSAA